MRRVSSFISFVSDFISVFQTSCSFVSPVPNRIIFTVSNVNFVHAEKIISYAEIVRVVVCVINRLPIYVVSVVQPGTIQLAYPTMHRLIQVNVEIG